MLQALATGQMHLTEVPTHTSSTSSTLGCLQAVGLGTGAGGPHFRVNQSRLLGWGFKATPCCGTLSLGILRREIRDIMTKRFQNPTKSFLKGCMMEPQAKAEERKEPFETGIKQEQN